MRFILINIAFLFLANNSCSQNNNYPYYPISAVTTEDTMGVADSANVYCKLSGTIYGGDFRVNGYDFQILSVERGKQVGIQVFGFNLLGYTVKEGDSVDVFGRIRQFQGRTYIQPDSIVRVDSFRVIPAPVKVADVNEATESKLLTYRNLIALNAYNGIGNYNILVTDGSKSFQIRVDIDTEVDDSLQNHPISIGDTICSVTGFGSQFDITSPYFSGYQIFPYYYRDLEINNCGSPCIKPIPDFFFSKDTICQDDTLFLNNTSTSINTSSDFYWDFDNDGIVDFESFNSFVQFQGSGIYEVELTVMNNFCTDTIVKTVVVNTPFLPVYDTVRVCMGQMYTMPDSAIIQVLDTVNYLSRLSSQSVCDSLIYTVIYPDTVDIRIMNNSPSLVALSQNASFQWLDCNNSYSPLINDTMATFTPSQNGNYAVSINQNGCIDTSLCYNILNVGIEDFESEDNLIAYPNPTNSVLDIIMHNNREGIDQQVKLHGIDGKLILQKKVNSSSTRFDLSNLECGVYFIRWNNFRKKIIKY